MVPVTTTFSYAARNPAMLRAPMPKLTIRPASAVLAWTEAERAAFCLSRDRNNLEAAERAYAGARALLGEANAIRGAQAWTRRRYQAEAMRRINAARATLRRARAALAASLAAAPAVAA